MKPPKGHGLVIVFYEPFLRYLHFCVLSMAQKYCDVMQKYREVTQDVLRGNAKTPDITGPKFTEKWAKPGYTKAAQRKKSPP